MAPAFFKRLFAASNSAYLLFLAGIVLIFVWAIMRRGAAAKEAFEDGGANAAYVTAAPYKFHMYYADWCPHCHAAKPEFDKLGPKLTIGGKSIACEAIEAEKNPDRVLSEVKGYPTIHLYDAQGKLLQEYSGERTEQGFRSFLEDVLNRPGKV